MQRALRAVVRGVREPTAEERAEFAAATPETRAFLTVKIAEQREGMRMPAWAIQQLEEEARAYADALGTLRAERERLERQEATGESGLPFALEEVGVAEPQSVRQPPATPPTYFGFEPGPGEPVR